MAVTETSPSTAGGTPVGEDPAGPGAAAPTRRVAALDGLRGFALIGMLLWHAEVGWVQGGFARMTIFFALSGYLATRSWIRIRQRQGGDLTSFREFWWRRARRLLPVSFVGIAFAVAVTWRFGSVEMRNQLGGDVLSVLAYVSNIRFWQSGKSYGELFTEPSLLQHYWTLSIEEQAFFVLPLLLAVTAVATRHRNRLAAVAVAAIGVVCAGLPAVVEHTPDAVWYSSIVRFGEFCGGVALALWTADRARRGGRSNDRLLAVAGAVALASIAVVMVTIPRDAEWLYRGGMALVVIPTVITLAAAARSVGPAATVLGLRPLETLGRWTFSIYVLHWPLFFVLDGARLGLGGWQLATVRLTAAVVLGAVMHVLIERPLMSSGPIARTGTGFAGARARRDALDRWLTEHVPSGWWRTRPAAATLAVAAVALGAVGFVPATDDGLDFGELENDWPTIAELKMLDPDEGDVEFGLFGGSTSLRLAMGGDRYLHESDELAIRPGVSPLGCGLVTEGVRKVTTDEITGDPVYDPSPETCTGWQESWPEVAEIGETEVALVMVGVWDTGDFRIDGMGETHVGEPAFDQLLMRHLDTMRDGFAEAGVEQIQLATTPVVLPGRGQRIWSARGLDDSHPERVEAFNELLRQFAAEHDDVTVIEYGSWVDELDTGEAREMFPDGVHPTDAAGDRIWREFLGDAVVQAFEER